MEPDPTNPLNEPLFLSGPDYEIHYDDGIGDYTVTWGDTRLEAFEPTVNANQQLAFSAFLAGDNSAYQTTTPQFMVDDPNNPGSPVAVNFDRKGVPSRLLNVSDDAIANSKKQTDGTLTKTLAAALYGYRVVPSADPTDMTIHYAPKFVPDASPTYYPLNSRFVVFVSARDYVAGTPPSYRSDYTSLFVWDTTREANFDPTKGIDWDNPRANPRRILKLDKMSILQPQISPDGLYITFTVTDMAFPETAYGPAPAGGGSGRPGALAADVDSATDPVYGFDVSKDLLLSQYKARVWATTITIAANPANTTITATLNGGQPLTADNSQVTNFTDTDGNGSRDIMPFWSKLDQIGFSSDREDTDGDGVPDTAPTDPTSTFDAFAFLFPFTPASALRKATDPIPIGFENDAVPDQIPADLTYQGAVPSNEIKCAWAPIFAYNQYANAWSTLQPNIIGQSDSTDIEPTDAIWRLFFYQGSAIAQLKGDILVGLPDVTPKPTTAGGPYVQPGDAATITVKVNPALITYGHYNPDDPTEKTLTTQAFAIIKDPDNRIFDQFQAEVNEGIITTVFHQLDDFPVQVTQDDIAAYQQKYGTVANPPAEEFIVPLLPDDPQNPTKFSGQWATRLDPSDYMMDIVVEYVQQPDSDAPTLAVYATDNIAGFTTDTFIPYSRTLLVADFPNGQKAIEYTSNTASTAGEATESYFTARPHPAIAYSPSGPAYPVVSYLGTEGFSPLGPRIEWKTLPTTAYNAVTQRTDVGTDGAFAQDVPMTTELSPYINTYDLWRTQCHEPISAAILSQYLPYTHSQPGYPDVTQTRTQRVADRMVLWVAPHAGQLNGNAGVNSTTIGTLGNPATQALLVEFLNGTLPSADGTLHGQAGRLVIAGDDAAFLLASNDPASKNPLLVAMKVAFQSHYNPDVLTVYTGERTDMTASRGGNDVANNYGLNPIPYSTYEIHYLPPATEPSPSEIWLAPFQSFQQAGSNLNFVQHPVGVAYGNATHTREDAAFTNLYIDSITGISNALPVYTYNDGTFGAFQAETLPPIANGVPTQNTALNKSAFFAFGIEGIHREYYGPQDDNGAMHYHAKNPGASMLHNVMDWTTTGTIAGQVRITSDVATPSGVLVWAIDHGNAESIGRISGTAITDAQGNFVIDGLDSSLYDLYAYKTGIQTQNPALVPVDSEASTYAPPTFVQSGVTTQNILLVPAAPAADFKVVVTDNTSGSPVAGVPVTIRDITNTYSQTVTTDSTGTADFGKVPAGLFFISVPLGTYAGQDYAAYTNSPAQQTISSNATQTVSVKLLRAVVPPGPATISGTVTTVSGTPVVGAVITVLDSSGTTETPISGTNPTVTDDSGHYTLTVNAGLLTVKADASSATPAFTKALNKTVTALKDATTTVDFVFGAALVTFPANEVLMISAPYDYTGTSFRDVLYNGIPGVTDAILKSDIVAYNETAQSFTFYPTYPADTFHLGRGYGAKLPSAANVIDPGNTANASGGTYIVRGEIGWNLIGDPFTANVPWSGGGTAAVQVALRGDATNTKYTIEAAVTKGILESPLWGGYNTVLGSAYTGSYQQTTALEPWHGYWVKVSQPVLFYIPVPAVTTNAATSVVSLAGRQPLMPNVDQWGLNITAASGSLLDNGLALGMRHGAANGVDAGLDMAKPNVLDSTGPTLYTSFPGANQSNFASDIRPVTITANWSFTVNSRLTGGSVTLNWTNVGALPAGSSAVLIDSRTGRSVDMGTTAQYTYQPSGASESRNFQVVIRHKGAR